MSKRSGTCVSASSSAQQAMLECWAYMKLAWKYILPTFTSSNIQCMIQSLSRSIICSQILQSLSQLLAMQCMHARLILRQDLIT